MKHMIAGLISLVIGVTVSCAGEVPHVEIPLADLLKTSGVAERINEDKELAKWLPKDTATHIAIYCKEIIDSDGGWFSMRPKANIPGAAKGMYADNGDFVDQSVAYLGHDDRKSIIEGKQVKSIDEFVYIFTYSWKGKTASVIIPFVCSIKRYKDKQPELLAYEVNKKRSLIVVSSQQADSFTETPAPVADTTPLVAETPEELGAMTFAAFQAGELHRMIDLFPSELYEGHRSTVYSNGREEPGLTPKEDLIDTINRTVRRTQELGIDPAQCKLKTSYLKSPARGIAEELWIVDVVLIVTANGKDYKILLDGCRKVNKRWHLLQVDWFGEGKLDAAQQTH